MVLTALNYRSALRGKRQLALLCHQPAGPEVSGTATPEENEIRVHPKQVGHLHIHITSTMHDTLVIELEGSTLQRW